MERDLPLEEEDFYLSPEGYRVFTEKYHQKGGIVVSLIADTAPMVLIPKL